MLRSSRLISFCATAAIVLLSLACLSCGTSSSSHTLSPAQAQAVSSELSQALQSALLSGLTPSESAAIDRHPSLPAILEHMNSSPTGCTITNSGESCNIPITYTGNCPNGGTVGVTGDLIFTLDDSGDGSANPTLTITPTNCAVSNTTFNGDPNVMVTSQILFQNSALAFPLTLAESGGISFGPNPAGSCTLNVTLTATSATSCTVTGTICGQSVTGSC